jgi:hypothetical protein
MANLVQQITVAHMTTSTIDIHNRLRFLRLLWLATFALMSLLFLAGIPGYYRQMLLAPSAPFNGLLDPAMAAILAEADMSSQVYTLYRTVAALLSNFLIVLVALLIFWRRNNERGALVMSYLLLLMGIGSPTIGGGLIQLGAAGVWLSRIISAASANAVTLTFFLFPTGRFVPRWTKWVALAFFLFTLPNFLAPNSRLDFTTLMPTALLLITFPLLGTFIYAQVYRYRRLSGPVERLQTRWAMIGLLAYPVAWGIRGLIIELAPDLVQTSAATLRSQILLDLFLFQPLYLLFPIGMGIAILRYRLWDIDLIIRKTLTYSLLTGLLALVYFGTVAVLQQVFTGLMGRQPAAIIVISTLLIAALFTPLRRRIQSSIDRRFYRRKYDAQQVLARFADNARQETDPDRLTAELVNVIQETLQPQGITLWLKPATQNDKRPNSPPRAIA